MRTAYDTALAALRRGESAGQVIKQLLDAGADRQMITEALQLVHETLKHDAERIRQERLAEIRQILIDGIREGETSIDLQQRLRARGVPADTAARLVRAARRSTTHCVPSSQTRRVANIIAVSLVVLALLAGWYRFRHDLRPLAAIYGVAAAATTIVAGTVPVANAVVAQRLNVPSGPGPVYPLLLQLPTGTPVQVIGRAQDVVSRGITRCLPSAGEYDCRHTR